MGCAPPNPPTQSMRSLIWRKPWSKMPGLSFVKKPSTLMRSQEYRPNDAAVS